jgi:hypothetical protein
MNKLDISRDDFIEIARGVFPGIRDDVSILVSNPKYMGKKERSWLRHYKVIDRGILYEFDAYLLTFIDDSQMLCVAKYEVNGREVTHAIYGIGQGFVGFGKQEGDYEGDKAFQ